MLLRGLSITGDIFRASIKDMSLLYEYWCFIKLNSLLRNNPKYILKSQDIVKAQGNGIYVSLVQGKPSTVKYQHQTTQETIELSYNPKETNVPTITQKPDNVLTLEKKGIETKLAKVDWSVRDVLIGTMRDRKQFEVCLHEHSYYILADKIGDDKFPIHYVALYQSKNIFGTEAGVRVYGEVTKCACVQRKDITEIPARPGTERKSYYRFEIKKWMYLESPILPKEMRFVKSFTNLFLLESSTEMPELWIRSEEEYRLYYELKRSVRNIAISESSEDVGFNFNNCSIIFDNQTIRLRGKNGTTKNYSISEFTKRPNAVFRQIKKDILLLEENAPMESDIQIR